MGKTLGLGSPTSIGVVAEVPGIMPSEAYHNKASQGGYTKGMALNSSMGQGDVNVTPLQLAMVYASFANHGKLYKPQLVHRIEDQDGHLIEEFKPQVVRTVDIDPAARKAINEALIAVAEEPGGTAYRSRQAVKEGLKGIQVAGKTGTAQVVRLGTVRLKTHQMDYFHRDHAWFAGYAPADNPELAIVVLNEHGGHGGSDAAPTAMAIFQRYFEAKREDATAPPPRANQPYVNTIPAAPTLQDVTVTRSVPHG
jgi:penicillin-binding protein 2